MGYGAVAAQVAVPPVRLPVEPHLVDAAVEDVEPLLALLVVQALEVERRGLCAEADGRQGRGRGDLEVGELVSVVPESLLELPEQGSARKNERARSPVVLVRMRPDEIAPAQGRENWHVDGVVAYSKICTHVGCPVSLYERTTHHLLCPCHQATFDLADSGAVVFGPATRPLPQLPLAVDNAGYLVAQSDFTEPVGPSHWELEA